ncbi:hypothetical protein [Bradyrhizobium retamae]|uniref:Uncharacterized protein n=1 Tax=Bradyrhizobium retamae TaxID=1300035 RepID=A0A0R3MN76_9BRAD|nr:hypothetical protein [Bradyrhizobium retamae]KRR21684.1 hypothetical protein CQ13_06435 [Bradyrhizobium retamae]
MQITLTLTKGMLERLDALRESSINTATAKALTFTAKDAQMALRTQVPAMFVIRRPWIVGGIRIKPANGGNLKAQVGSIDKYMERHVIGAGREKQAANSLSIRSKRGSNGRLATGGILIKPYGSIASAPVHTVVRRRLNRMENQKKKPFQIVSGGRVFIVRRKGKARKPLQSLAMLQNSADISENWDFFGTVSGVVQSRFPHHFYRAVVNASTR